MSQFVFYCSHIFFKEKILINFNLIIQAAITGILFSWFLSRWCLFLIHRFICDFISFNCWIAAYFNKYLKWPYLKERVTLVQWFGIILGFIGTVLVIGYDIGKTIPINGVIASIVALLGATTATIWQKNLQVK